MQSNRSVELKKDKGNSFSFPSTLRPTQPLMQDVQRQYAYDKLNCRFVYLTPIDKNKTYCCLYVKDNNEIKDIFSLHKDKSYINSYLFLQDVKRLFYIDVTGVNEIKTTDIKKLEQLMNEIIEDEDHIYYCKFLTDNNINKLNALNRACTLSNSDSKKEVTQKLPKMFMQDLFSKNENNKKNSELSHKRTNSCGW